MVRNQEVNQRGRAVQSAGDVHPGFGNLRERKVEDGSVSRRATETRPCQLRNVQT